MGRPGRGRRPHPVRLAELAVVSLTAIIRRLLQQRDPVAAKRHILEALADAPRFREGHKLLLKMPAQGESK